LRFVEQRRHDTRQFQEIACRESAARRAFTHCARYGGPATTTGTKRIGSSWTKTAGIVPGCTPIFTVSKGIWITPVIGIAKHTISRDARTCPEWDEIVAVLLEGRRA